MQSHRIQRVRELLKREIGEVIRREISINEARDRVLAHFGQIDILVNAAGRIAKKPTKDLPEAEWGETIETNVTGILRACQAFYEPLARSGHGRIINIVSLTSFVSFKEVAAYSASKSALLSLTRSLGTEWAPDGINVNAIAPGVFRTDLNRTCWTRQTGGASY